MYLATFVILGGDLDSGYLVQKEIGKDTDEEFWFLMIKLCLCLPLWGYNIRREIK